MPVSVSVICVFVAVTPSRGNVAAFSPEIQPDSPLPPNCAKLDAVLSAQAFERAARNSALALVSCTVKASPPLTLVCNAPVVVTRKIGEAESFSMTKGGAVWLVICAIAKPILVVAVLLKND